ncbi:hypothetical protein GCM10010168_72070 [Actinoplanes ianthinogenes]|uniref:Uncharacterized protein n=1 Tax=Actinoplanes ianthinogenes TaxID=122358 RepID=A0ABM7M6J4_9ACTN|nr:hypothetical protein [Actinoplanes ianthinogenes]BCJ47204.1 hypothetical protein Aiant_78610 [Actinoplanes ianthinogenes]GGR42698.1 hypothetical protein GCM10010168_72070 [Actinoplanes ianthinogenes]
MDKNEERGMLRRFLSLVLAVLLAAVSPVVADDTSGVDVEAPVTVVVADSTRVLFDQVIASAGDSRAPPAHFA